MSLALTSSCWNCGKSSLTLRYPSFSAECMKPALKDHYICYGCEKELVEQFLKDKKMKPFNLEEALSGKPVITRKGLKVLGLHNFGNLKDEIDFSLVAIVEKEGIIAYTEEGKYFKYDAEEEKDLFMASEKKTMWMAYCPSESKASSYGMNTSSLYESEEELRSSLLCDWNHWTIIPVEIEV